ncbi:unnamed protein product [Timema podura]|uniref:DDE Tnp4 domain-containing protein n=1 Tax=Timema podura TaxID=61482 RepID=A0ABN7PPD4_TIMPD|nr:unnamed protein product [Timema podura]
MLCIRLWRSRDRRSNGIQLLLCLNNTQSDVCDPLYSGHRSSAPRQACDSAMHILNVNSRYPGRTHDAFIYANSNVRAGLVELATHQGNQNILFLSDIGYCLEPWLMTPIEGEGSPESLYNCTHSSTRNMIEYCNGLLKGRFRCILKHRVLHYSPEITSIIINTCAVLHSTCIKENFPLYDEIPLNN